jgi:hypothetical protein
MAPAGTDPIVGRSRNAVAALALVLVAEIGTIASDAIALPWLDDPTDVDAASRFDTVTGIAALVEFLALIVAAIFFIRWFNLMYRSLDSLCPGARRYATWWSIGGWFIPIMSLFRPKQMLNDMVRCAYGAQTAPWWASVWWGMFVFASIAGNIDGRVSINAETIDEIQASTTFDIFATAIYVATAPLAIIVVRRLTEAMEAKRHAVVAQPAIERYGDPVAPP